MVLTAARRARQGRWLRGRRTLAVDSTALDARYASSHYRYRYSAGYRAAYATLHGGRAPAADHWRPHHPKLTVAADVGTPLLLAAVPARGPENDLYGVEPVLTQATALAAAHGLTIGALVADAGYDAERVHVFCRETLGIPATAIRLNPKTCGRRGPRGRYRRRMYRRFPCGLYRRRQQVESVFSRLKRRLSAALTARTAATQAEELVLRVLTHNLLLLLRRRTAFQQSQCHAAARPVGPARLRPRTSIPSHAGRGTSDSAAFNGATFSSGMGSANSSDRRATPLATKPVVRSGTWGW